MVSRWYTKSTYLLSGVLCLVILLVSLYFALQKPVYIAVDGKTIEDRVFFSSTVEQVLEQNKVALDKWDQVQPGLDTPIKKNCHIEVIRAFNVTVIADGERHDILTVPVSVEEAIERAGITVGEQDIIKTAAASKTVPDQEIEVIRVTEEMVEEEQPLPFQVETTEDNTLEKGLTRTLRQGINGSVLNSVKVTFHNGQEVKREVIDSKTMDQPVNKIVAMGNITTVSRGNQNIHFREALYVQASAYTYTGRNTATGRKPAVGLVAVDPQVIPMGSKLYIEGYGYAVAADTGGAIKGNRIDVFMEDRSQCMSWGRRNVKVYILE